jgi:hypothetical protein
MWRLALYQRDFPLFIDSEQQHFCLQDKRPVVLTIAIEHVYVVLNHGMLHRLIHCQVWITLKGRHNLGQKLGFIQFFTTGEVFKN